MVDNLQDLHPSSVFKYFKEISSIPRCSGFERKISDYLVDFAKTHNLEVIQDDALNVIIKKPPTKGYENAPTVILQGHMDMVGEKDTSIEHDFLKDPIRLKIEGDFIKAEGTTLGADDGIAVAYCLAILESDNISCGPLEVLLTTGEENGMIGASSLDLDKLSGEILINIDSEKEGELLVSCAGGVRSEISLTIELEERKEGFVPFIIEVKGLKGGHSGGDIDKGRGNSNKLIGRVLSDINSHMEIYISEINGGYKSNVIPKISRAVIFVKDENKNTLIDIINKWDKIFKNEFRVSDSEVTVEFKDLGEKFYRVFSKALTDRIICLLNLIPQGVQTMSMDISGLVESSNNLGVVKTNEDEVTFENLTRSSVGSLKYKIVDEIKILCKIIGGAVALKGDYPEWQYEKNSYIRQVFTKVYKDMYKKDPKITAIHAGLECGILSEALQGIDMISFGPDIFDIHTPNERLSISSTKRTYEYLIQVLKSIK